MKMLKMIMCAIASLLLAGTAVAGDRRSDVMVEPAYDISLSLREMVKVMHLDIDQYEILDQTNTSLTRRVSWLAGADPERRPALLQQALGDNLVAVSRYLDRDQMVAYRGILRRELESCHLDQLLTGGNLAMLR